MLVGFKKRFAEPIQKGTKVFTMRDKPKRMPKVGETMYMYSGLRTSHCFKISDKEKLMGIQQVLVGIKRRWTSDNDFDVEIVIMVDNYMLFSRSDKMKEFVQFDGFEDEKDFASFWLGDTPKTNRKSRKVKNRITGKKVMFHWTDLKY